MRILTVLVALVATPFVVSVAQRPAPKAKNVRPASEEVECKDRPAGNAYGWDKNHACGPTLGSISGAVFYDLSYDGVRDADEWGIENWLIMLDGPGISTTVVTDAAGNYSFPNLPAGTYTVCESQRFGWIQTAPTEPNACTSGIGYTITIVGGQVVTGRDFGNVG